MSGFFSETLKPSLETQTENVLFPHSDASVCRRFERVTRASSDDVKRLVVPFHGGWDSQTEYTWMNQTLKDWKTIYIIGKLKELILMKVITEVHFSECVLLLLHELCVCVCGPECFCQALRV